MALLGLTCPRRGWIMADMTADHEMTAEMPSAQVLLVDDEPDHVEDVTGYLEAKLAALLSHESQFESTMASGDDPELTGFRRRVEAKLAAAGKAGGVDHAEVFKLIDDL